MEKRRIMAHSDKKLEGLPTRQVSDFIEKAETFLNDAVNIETSLVHLYTVRWCILKKVSSS